MPLNDAVTDSVTQVNTAVVGETPAMAQGNLMLSTSQAMGFAAHNSTGANQQATIVLHSATVQGINSLFSTGAAIVGRSSEAILEKEK
ncbi:RebB family R body protein [Marinomonas mediterranea]|jgi:Killing trait.|uniref:Anaerobic glycerol-3-phosphate dehydrogenase subunit C n=1 Tax=Marinomonas mediterranea (strain ATCC 700492 / JCM 21426 / NBRC 103028 / MMB-1) TaxID=717774 RepID=F2JXK8_MARM1|nr:RebB family R body protein [Marinomonas mediterranea]ADZ91908.1 anaerobic glycerol-3-phosphate dehydrogenase subunit C [Marinomonas mediterranea MMB-1]WCN09858.1 glycerol-3-phosphate dehydrogenase subunit C [Marinomonas mediterranea]WCN13942.1 glycerol-3-phosphate dehydrogenase subunit C [Marinomonas mediterranea]WCN17994.1 glycerol-3-phosphate dehydrogenase subunit C [Marinomonas mediterranea MMB-1]